MTLAGGGESFPVFAGLLATTLLFSGCQVRLPWTPPEPHMSPTPITLDSDPWARADQIAAEVPGGRVYMGHGASMEPLYPSGTVIVLQRIEWDHLRQGMTVVMSVDPNNPFVAVSSVLVSQDSDNRWKLQGLNNNRPYAVPMTESNYVGTVVAAIVGTDAHKIAFEPSELTPENTYCTLRCHIEGQLHPARLPGE